MRTEQIQRASARGEGRIHIDRALRLLSPMDIKAVEQSLSDERRADFANKYEDIYRFLEVVLSRWKQIWVAEDHSRGNPIDSWFLANHQATLWDFFDNRCSRCGARPSQFRDRTIDHAFTPFSRGGTFMMLDPLTKQWVLNAIPLCRSCNSTKGHRPIDNFFTPEELLRVTQRLKQYPIERAPSELPQLE